MSPEQLIELLFPTGGINTEREFQLQPADTTPIAVNVRAVDPTNHANRGASRCGIRKYVEQKLGLFSLIQHLNVIVDPTIEFTLSEADIGYWEADSDPAPGPRGRRMRRSAGPGYTYMRKGGSGRRYRKNTLKPGPLDDTIEAEWGGAAVQVQPLDNDQYSGAATVEIVRVSRNFKGTWSLSGPVGGWTFTYTPPPIPDPPKRRAARTMLAGYSLEANGNKGKGGARIIINLAEYNPDPGPPPSSGSLTLTTLNSMYFWSRDTWPYNAVGLGFQSVNTYDGPNAEVSTTVFWLVEAEPGFEYELLPGGALGGPPGSGEYVMFITDQSAVWSELTGDENPPTFFDYIPNPGETTITLEWLRGNAGVQGDFWTNDGIEYPVP